MKIYKACFVCLPLFLPNPAFSTDMSCHSGKDGTITIEACVDQLHNIYDVELNEKYQKILEELKATSRQRPALARAREQLIISQRSWIKFRDNDCKALASFLPADPANESKHSICMMERTKQRVKELKEWTDLLSKQVSSAPPFSTVEFGNAIAGQPLSFWIQHYWQWERSFPPGNQPSNDTTGSKCGIRQNQPVFFLTGSTHLAPVSRTCTIPRNKYVLIPVINVLAQSDDPTVDCDTYVKAVRELNDGASDLSLSVNGQESGSLINSKADSGCFHLNDATRGVSGMAAGAGYWVVLKPLRPGNYLLHFSGNYPSNGFSQDVTYRIEVE